MAVLQTHAGAAGKIGWTVSVDSTISRAHQHAAGAPRSRGGWTVKTASGVRAGPQGSGGSGDWRTARRQPQFTTVLHRTSKANREHLRRRGIKACIPSNADQDAHRRAKGAKGGRPPGFDPVLYRLRHAVECGVGHGYWSVTPLIHSRMMWRSRCAARFPGACASGSRGASPARPGA
jgi:hypothetical protein